MPGPISFRRLSHDDVPMLHRWLNEPAVVQWWEGEDVSWDAVVRDYDPDDPDSTEHWIASLDGVDIGWIQCYPAIDEPEESEPWWALGIDRSAAGIDYLLSESAGRGRGVGSAMIRAFVDEVVFGLHPTWTQACAAPFEGNEPSWRALEKSGFRFVGLVDSGLPPPWDGQCKLMAINRPDATSD